MTTDSQMSVQNADYKDDSTSAPRKTTINYIRQFSRVCVSIEGTVFSSLNAN